MSAMDGEETPKSSSKKFPGQKSIDTYAVQCHQCHKWRVIDSQEEFEDIRSKISEEPFYCDGKSGVSCEDPADLEYNATRTWAIDKPNLSKPPEGFKRHLVVRKDNSKMDVYYITPQGKRLRSQKDIAAYLKANPSYEGISETDFDFARPKIMDDTLPKVVGKMGSGSSHKKAKMGKDE